jgi:hypothetical protein
MDSITLHSRLCGIFGLLYSATEQDILNHAQALMEEAAHATPESEHDRLVREKMAAMNCERWVAEFAVSEQQRYDRNPEPHGV